MAIFRPHFRLAKLVGEHEVEWKVGTVRDLIAHGRLEYGSRFDDELRYATITVNGRAVAHLNGMNTPLSDSDEVSTIFPSSD